MAEGGYESEGTGVRGRVGGEWRFIYLESAALLALMAVIGGAGDGDDTLVNEDDARKAVQTLLYRTRRRRRGRKALFRCRYDAVQGGIK